MRKTSPYRYSDWSRTEREGILEYIRTVQTNTHVGYVKVLLQKSKRHLIVKVKWVSEGAKARGNSITNPFHIKGTFKK